MVRRSVQVRGLRQRRIQSLVPPIDVEGKASHDLR